MNVLPLGILKHMEKDGALVVVHQLRPRCIEGHYLLHRVPPRVQFPDRTGLTAGLRYRFTGPVRPVTGRNRSNVNLNSNFTVVAVPTGIPAGYTGIPAGLAGIPAGFVLRLTAVYRPVTPVYRPVWPVYRLFRVFFRRLKN